MLRFLKKLKSNKGMTLTELMVGIALMALLMAALAGVLVPMSRAQREANEYAEINALLDNISSPIVSDLSRATALLTPCGTCSECASDPDDCNHENNLTVVMHHSVTYTIDGTNGTLLVNGIPVLPKRFHRAKSISFTCVEATGAGTAYELTVFILHDGVGSFDDRLITSRTYAVKPLALNTY